MSGWEVSAGIVLAVLGIGALFTVAYLVAIRFVARVERRHGEQVRKLGGRP